MAMAPRHDRGGPRAAESRPDVDHNRRPAAQLNDTLSIPDWQDRRAALDRLQAQEDQRRIATALQQLGADLVRYYGPRRWAA